MISTQTQQKYPVEEKIARIEKDIGIKNELLGELMKKDLHDEDDSMGKHNSKDNEFKQVHHLFN